VLFHISLANFFPRSIPLFQHAGIPEEARLALGITPNLVRLSVGVEDVEDLIADVDQAIRKAVSVTSA
jgi:cystathionine beta-lyase/cystathionine gamma-synthase